jgi:hypothetical protein
MSCVKIFVPLDLLEGCVGIHISKKRTMDWLDDITETDYSFLHRNPLTTPLAKHGTPSSPLKSKLAAKNRLATKLNLQRELALIDARLKEIEKKTATATATTSKPDDANVTLLLKNGKVYPKTYKGNRYNIVIKCPVSITIHNNHRTRAK